MFDFISHLAKRTDNSIPLALLDQASWALGCSWHHLFFGAVWP